MSAPGRSRGGLGQATFLRRNFTIAEVRHIYEWSGVKKSTGNFQGRMADVFDRVDDNR
ncbi:MAG: hypothetical protein WBL05_03945 [Brooklawnia sp.]|uniref:hypothetical protein n=1 Tax=Brooklawnia sp. TaxID=2699740 RepID=UPI003C76BFE7